MSLIKPISYWQRRRVSAPSGGIPLSGNILLRYEKPNINMSGTSWSDTSGLGYTSGVVSENSSPAFNVTNGALRLYNGTTNPTKNAKFSVTTNTNIGIKSLCILFDIWDGVRGSGGTRNYFWDMRSANTESPNNGGYYNQYDSISTATTSIWYNGALYAYDDATNTTTNNLATTPTNLTNGTNNANGGTAVYQWLGPNGKSTYTKRLWLFNFSSTKDLNLTTSAVRGLVFGNNDGGTFAEGSPLGIYAIIGWNTYFNSTNFADLKTYFINEGIIT